MMQREDFELMAPVGSMEALSAAIHAGADSVYFGVGKLNMRAHSATAFTAEDLPTLAAICRQNGVKSYLAVNTIIYNEDVDDLRQLLDQAREAGIDAVIASDIAVMSRCREIGIEVHLSTQLNISNTEALRFYSHYADVVVLARELNLWQVRDIHHAIEEEPICGPSGERVRIEMFCHGALCMAVSGKCYMSLHQAGRSANRGECVQICRRGYEAKDLETGEALRIDNKYILSPKDLKTIRFLDLMAAAGVRVFKIEGRARGPEYVHTVVKAYDEALCAVAQGTLQNDPKRLDEWDHQLASVFNRGFWDGYYQGQRLGEWSDVYGSKATEQKVFCGRCMKFFSRLSVAEFLIANEPLTQGDKVLITGPTTGAIITTAAEVRLDDQPVPLAPRGAFISIAVPAKVRPSDKLYILRPRSLR